MPTTVHSSTLAPKTPDDPATYATRCLQIDLTDLVGEYQRIPQDMAYWASLAADAEQDYQLAKAEHDATYATAVLAATASGIKPDLARKAAADANELVRETAAKLAQAAGERARARAMVDGLRAKLECAISLGHHVRAELRGHSL
jgi:D-aminopeptidase